MLAYWRPLLWGVLLLPGFGGAAVAADPGTVTTDATVSVRLPNTIADVTLYTEVRAKTLAEVQTRLTASSGALIEYLRTAPVRRTMTNEVTIDTDTDPKPAAGQQARVVGYYGRVSVFFEVDADALGTVVPNALVHGANTVERTNLHPRDAELDSKRKSLVAEATRRAIDEARAMANAAGRQLGAVRRIRRSDVSEDTSQPSYGRVGGGPPPPPAPAGAAPLPTGAGDTELSTTVTVTVDLVEPEPAPR